MYVRWVAYQHQHIVPNGYLKFFAENGMVAAHPAAGGRPTIISTRDSAVRRGFYTYTRHDGVRTTAVETAMQPAEDHGLRLLRELEARWPLTTEDRATLGEYVALQVVRTPAWRRDHDVIREQILERHEADLRRELGPELLALHVEEMRHDATRARAMLRQPAKIGSLLGSMQLTLLRFDDDALITADHPVAAVAVDAGGGIPSTGYGTVPEYRFAVSPRLGLLFSWLDADDVVVSGSPFQARAMNCSMRAQAEVHWFCPPSATPSFRGGSVTPLTFGIHTAYGPDSVAMSHRRKRIIETIDQQIESQEDVAEITIVAPEGGTWGRPAVKGGCSAELRGSPNVPPNVSDAPPTPPGAPRRTPAPRAA